MGTVPSTTAPSVLSRFRANKLEAVVAPLCQTHAALDQLEALKIRGGRVLRRNLHITPRRHPQGRVRRSDGLLCFAWRRPNLAIGDGAKFGAGFTTD